VNTKRCKPYGAQSFVDIHDVVGQDFFLAASSLIRIAFDE
jgi:hypothetical protein